MLARIAHELFWLGRSVARAEYTARLLEGVFNGQLEGRVADPSVVTLSWDAVLAMTGTRHDTLPAGASAQDTVIRLMVADRDQPASVCGSVDAARERARAVRDVISLEMWETINTLHMRVCQRDIGPELRSEPSAVFDAVRQRCSLFWGVQRRTMLRDESMAFLNAGAELEAADIVARMLRVTLPAATEHDESDSLRDGPALTLLRAVGGVQAFRRATSTPPHLMAVAKFLIFEAGFPDSIAACAESLRRQLARVDSDVHQAAPLLRLSRLLADLDFRRPGATGVDQLRDLLTVVQHEFAAVDADISARYFAGAERPALRVGAGQS